jgi:hypothetical protein
MRTLSVNPPAIVCVLMLLTGCGADLTVDQKYEHLRDAATKGADAHFVLINENKETTREVCEQHYMVFVPGSAPAEHSGFGSSAEWIQLSKDYFADSCVKGEPREIQTRPSLPSSPPSDGSVIASVPTS